MSSTKRKSSTAARGSSKKARTAHASAIAAVESILDDPDNYPVPDSPEDVRDVLHGIALYVKDLQEGGTQSGSAPSKSKEQLDAAAEKIRKAAVSGIEKQMTWKPSCKTGSAKFSYDGVCADPEIFGHMLGLGGPPKFKMKKYPIDEFDDIMGGIRGSARYDHLCLRGNNVTVRWSESGEFKMSGTYGK